MKHRVDDRSCYHEPLKIFPMVEKDILNIYSCMKYLQ